KVLWIEQRGGIWLPRFGFYRRCGVSDRRCVVLVCKSGEVMPELVNEKIRSLLTIRGNGAVQTEDPPASICSRVRDYLDESVRRKCGDTAKRPILKRQNV